MGVFLQNGGGRLGLTGIDPIWTYRVRRIAIRQRRGGEAGLARGYRLGYGSSLRRVASGSVRGSGRLWAVASRRSSRFGALGLDLVRLWV